MECSWSGQGLGRLIWKRILLLLRRQMIQIFRSQAFFPHPLFDHIRKPPVSAPPTRGNPLILCSLSAPAQIVFSFNASHRLVLEISSQGEATTFGRFCWGLAIWRRISLEFVSYCGGEKGETRGLWNRPIGYRVDLIVSTEPSVGNRGVGCLAGLECILGLIRALNMGSCMSSDGGGGDRSSLSPSSPSFRSPGLGSKKANRSGRKRQGSSRCSSFEATHGEDQIHRIPGRMFLNGSSNEASLFTQQGKKGTNQDAMVVWEVYLFWLIQLFICFARVFAHVVYCSKAFYLLILIFVITWDALGTVCFFFSHEFMDHLI